jgi:hypothetical protein
MKMLGDKAIRCEYGCCRDMPTHRDKERRVLKRRERNQWKKESKDDCMA